MAALIDFHKAKAERLLDAIRKGAALPVLGDEGWTYYDLMQVAGACVFAAFSQRPPDLPGSNGSKHVPSQAEQTTDQWFEDVQAAVEHFSSLTMLVADGDYDAQCEPRVQAVAWSDDDGQHVRYIAGDKLGAGGDAA